MLRPGVFSLFSSAHAQEHGITIRCQRQDSYLLGCLNKTKLTGPPPPTMAKYKARTGGSG